MSMMEQLEHHDSHISEGSAAFQNTTVHEKKKRATTFRESKQMRICRDRLGTKGIGKLNKKLAFIFSRIVGGWRERRWWRSTHHRSAVGSRHNCGAGAENRCLF